MMAILDTLARSVGERLDRFAQRLAVPEVLLARAEERIAVQRLVLDLRDDVVAGRLSAEEALLRVAEAIQARYEADREYLRAMSFGRAP